MQPQKTIISNSVHESIVNQHVCRQDPNRIVGLVASRKLAVECRVFVAVVLSLVRIKLDYFREG
jgi:hypothetical protein